MSTKLINTEMCVCSSQNTQTKNYILHTGNKETYLTKILRM